MLATEEIVPVVHRGIDLFLPPWSDVLWSAVVLAIIAFAFYRFVMPKFMTVLDQRAQLIDGGIKQAEQVREAAQQTLVERHKMLEEAQVEAAKTRAAARAEGEAIIQQQKEVAAQEAARIEANAQRNIEAQRQLAESQLQKEVGTLAAELAGKIIGEELVSDSKKSATVDRVIAGLEKANLAQGTDGARVRGGFDALADTGDTGVIADIGGEVGAIDGFDPDLPDGYSAEGIIAGGVVGSGSAAESAPDTESAEPLVTKVVKERHHFLRKHK